MECVHEYGFDCADSADKNDTTINTQATEEKPTEAAAAEDAPTVAEVVVTRP